MPRIDAPTVAEHHRRRRAALLAAATDVLAEQGLEGLTVTAVGSAAGLARSSVYQYFASTPALLAAVVEDAMPRSTARLAAAVSRARTPSGKVDAYLRTALAAATEPTQRSMHALESAQLPADCQDRLVELHQQQYAPLRCALVELGVEQPDLTMRLLLGLLHAAAAELNRGAPKATVLRRTRALVQHGLTGHQA